MRTGTARVAARGSRLCVRHVCNYDTPECATWSELSWGGKQADFARVCFCTRKRQQASEALDSARAKAGTVLNFIPAFSYFSTEAITFIVIYRRIEFFFSTSNIQFSTQICHSALRYFTDSHNMQQISSQICISKFLHLRRHIGKKSICALDVIYLSLHLLRISLFILLIL